MYVCVCVVLKQVFLDVRVQTFLISQTTRMYRRSCSSKNKMKKKTHTHRRIYNAEWKRDINKDQRTHAYMRNRKKKRTHNTQ